MNAVGSNHPAFAAQAPRSVRLDERVIRQRIATASKQLVAQALVTPILAQFRESMPQGGMFGVTDAEKRLGPVLDQRIADSMVHRARWPIVDRVELSMLKRAHLDPTPDPKPRFTLGSQGVIR
jgi:hypothetical protein